VGLRATVARFTSTVDTIAYGFKVARASSEERASLYDLDVALQPNFLGVDLIEHCRQRDGICPVPRI
jgi:hypothetical protein